jgi:geranylgeranyl pyrophosphate synthase
VDAQQAFPSIAPALQVVEAELSGQAAAIVADWGSDGASTHELQRVVHHVFAAKGKLLRPALVLLSAGLARPRAEMGAKPGGAGRQGGGREPGGRSPVEAGRAGRLEPALVRLATAVELLHSASLVHDDIIDGEPLRRGQATLNRRFGDHTAVLVGDLLYARCFALLNSLELAPWERQQEIFTLFFRTTQAMCLGEIREQQVLESGTRVDFEEYLSILRKKTAELMSACCRGAAIACDAPAPLAAVLAEFGLSFGLAFQLLDDAVDHDALVADGADLRAAAQASLARARGLLSDLAPGPCRSELEAACDLILAVA